MKNRLLTIIIVTFFLSCENISNEELSLYDLIPENSQVVISVKNLGKFNNSIENNNYLTSVVESNLTLKNLLSQLSKINNDKEIVIGLYGSDDILHFNIIGFNISNDSITEKKLSYEKIDIISSNNSYKPKINYNELGEKLKKINQTNTNFSIALDSSKTTKLLNKIFDKEYNNADRNLILNVDATSNLVSINGVVDNYPLNTDDDDKLAVQEIINSEIGVYFDYENDLIEDYDLISSNQEKQFNIFNFEDLNPSFKDYKIFQLKQGDNIININGFISNFQKEVRNLPIDLKFETTIENEIILGPLMVKNHINNSNELIIQDSENILYLINNMGQIEWTKKINGKIIDEINQIDSYKNGKLQYVFATEKSLYLLDRKGRNVGRFPLNFNDKITKPLSVFDYDNNKNYRLLVTQNNELFMFDSKGKRVKGFNYTKKNKILTKPKHFRISNKDIIVFKTVDKLTILNRRGAVRINTKKEYNYSNHAIFQHQNFLLTSTVKNEIVKIDMKGNTAILEKSMPFNSKVISDKKMIFTLQKNILSNSKNTFEIQFGKYENFKIYYGNKKSYVNIFDSENNKVYLFDEGLKLINGFPISSIQNADFSISSEGIEFSKKTESKKFTYQTVK